MFSLRSVATVGGLTLASRALGFLREVLIARLLGTGPVAEAFFVAMRLPNLFRQMFAEGAFNAAFVPMFAGKLEQDGQQRAKAFAEDVLASLLTVLLLLTLVAELAMPWLIRVFAPGFYEYPDKFGYAVLFTGITFPYLLFMSLCALQGGVLNALGRFAHAAAAPILLNVVLILALLFAVPHWPLRNPGFILAWAASIAGAVQFLWLAIACHRAGMGLRLPLPRLTPEVRRMAKLMVPGIVAGGVNQINLTVATILATLQAQAVGYLYYADRLYQLPLALIGSAIGVVLLPSLARSIRGGREAEAERVQNRAIELGLFMSLPSAVALLTASLPIITVLYQRGAFTPEDAHHVALALGALALGLPAYVMNKALSPGFLARQDTMTPFKFALATVATDIVVSILLFQFIGYVGIALGTAISAWLNAGLLYVTLRRRGHMRADARLKRTLPRLILANVVLGAALWFGSQALAPWFALGEAPRAIALAVLVGGAIALYVGLVFATGAMRPRDFKSWLSR